MENVSYATRLRFLDAADVDDAVVDYDGLNVFGPDGRKLGDVDGFIVDAQARRVNYLVIDSGGWFSSRRLLLPIGHATLASDRKSLRTDVMSDALGRLPEYQEDRFRKFTDEELRAFERNTVSACCPDEPLEEISDTTWGYDSRRHYTQPDWWRNDRYAQERLRPIEARAYRPIDPTAPVPLAAASAAGSRDIRSPERVTARERTSETSAGPGDNSPHLGGRAQPGDVLGIETGGERTAIGETAEDEDRRRVQAERALVDDEPRQSER